MRSYNEIVNDIESVKKELGLYPDDCDTLSKDDFKQVWRLVRKLSRLQIEIWEYNKDANDYKPDPEFMKKIIDSPNFNIELGLNS